MKYQWDMEFYKSLESKATYLVFSILGVSVALFAIYRDQAAWIGFSPLMFCSHYFLYREKYLKNFIGAFVEVTDANIEIVRPKADYKASVDLSSITEISRSRSFFLPSVLLCTHGGEKLELVNFNPGLANAIQNRLGQAQRAL